MGRIIQLTAIEFSGNKIHRVKFYKQFTNKQRKITEFMKKFHIVDIT